MTRSRTQGAARQASSSATATASSEVHAPLRKASLGARIAGVARRNAGARIRRGPTELPYRQPPGKGNGVRGTPPVEPRTVHYAAAGLKLVLVCVLTVSLAGCPVRPKNGDAIQQPANEEPGPPEVLNPSLLDRG
jgi:hypothetical protein